MDKITKNIIADEKSCGNKLCARMARGALPRKLIFAASLAAAAGLTGCAVSPNATSPAPQTGTQSAPSSLFAEPGGTWATPQRGDPNPSARDYTPFAVTSSAILVNETDPNNWLFSLEYLDVSYNRYFTNGTRGAVVFNNNTTAAFFDFTATIEGFAHGRENGIHIYDIIGLNNDAPPTTLDNRMFNSLAFVAVDAQRRISDAVKDGNIRGMSGGTAMMGTVPKEVQDYAGGFFIEGFTQDVLLRIPSFVIVPGPLRPPGFGWGPYSTYITSQP